MIKKTPIGYFVLVPGDAGYCGPYPSESAARAMLSNAMARKARPQCGAPRLPREKPEPPAVRVVKASGDGAPRRARRKRSVEGRREYRQAVKAARRKAARSLPAEALVRAGLAGVQRVD